MSTRFHSSDLRKGRYSASGQAYLVTTVTNARRPLFVEMRPARLVINAMRYHAEQGHVEPLAYVLMPDHMHWLFILREPLSLSQLIASVKGYSAKQIKRIMAKNDESTVWQPGYHDYAVRQHEDLRAMARYVVANPIRAGGAGRWRLSLLGCSVALSIDSVAWRPRSMWERPPGREWCEQALGGYSRPGGRSHNGFHRHERK